MLILVPCCPAVAAAEVAELSCSWLAYRVVRHDDIVVGDFTHQLHPVVLPLVHLSPPGEGAAA